MSILEGQLASVTVQIVQADSLVMTSIKMMMVMVRLHVAAIQSSQGGAAETGTQILVRSQEHGARPGSSYKSETFLFRFTRQNFFRAGETIF